MKGRGGGGKDSEREGEAGVKGREGEEGSQREREKE